MFNKTTEKASEWINLLNTRYGHGNYVLTRDGDRFIAKMKTDKRGFIVGSMRVATQRGDVSDMRKDVRGPDSMSLRSRRDVWSVNRGL